MNGSIERILGLRHVCFSSSGTHGLLFEGVVRALEDHIPEYDRWARELRGVTGTSGGAIAALALALSVNREVRNMLHSLGDFANVVRCPDVSLMMHAYGVDDGEYMKQLTRDLLTAGGLCASSTMADLHRLLRLDVVFVAHSMTEGVSVHLSAQNTPDMLVSDAVFASCCIPFVFTPLRYKDLVLCDGVLSECIPDVFPVESTLHVVIPPTATRHLDVDSWCGFMFCLLRACTMSQLPRIDAILAMDNTIRVSHPFMNGISTMNRFADGMIDAVIQCGYVVGMTYMYPISQPACDLLTKYVRIMYDDAAESRAGEYESEDDPHD